MLGREKFFMNHCSVLPGELTGGGRSDRNVMLNTFRWKPTRFMREIGRTRLSGVMFALYDS